MNIKYTRNGSTLTSKDERVRIGKTISNRYVVEVDGIFFGQRRKLTDARALAQSVVDEFCADAYWGKDVRDSAIRLLTGDVDDNLRTILKATLNEKRFADEQMDLARKSGIIPREGYYLKANPFNDFKIMEIAEGTPNYLDPTSETYHSM